MLAAHILLEYAVQASSRSPSLPKSVGQSRRCKQTRASSLCGLCFGPILPDGCQLAGCLFCGDVGDEGALSWCVLAPFRHGALLGLSWQGRVCLRKGHEEISKSDEQHASPGGCSAVRMTLQETWA